MDRPLSTAEVTRLLGARRAARARVGALRALPRRRATAGATRSRSRTSSCCARRRVCSRRTCRPPASGARSAALARELPRGRVALGPAHLRRRPRRRGRRGGHALAARDRPDAVRVRRGRASRALDRRGTLGDASAARRLGPARARRAQAFEQGARARGARRRRPRRRVSPRARARPGAQRRLREPRPPPPRERRRARGRRASTTWRSRTQPRRPGAPLQPRARARGHARAPRRAMQHYERALALDPDFADAHYNLAGLCEQLGRGADALRHYRAYKVLAST